MNLAQLIQSQNFARLLQALDAGNELTAGKTVQARLLSLHQRRDVAAVDVIGGGQRCGHARAPPPSGE